MIQQTIFATTLLSDSNYVNNSPSSSSFMDYTLSSFESLFAAISITTLILLIFLIIFVAFYIRWWMAQTAIFAMRQDIHDIRNQIVQDEARGYEDIIDTDDSPEDKPDDAERIRLIDTIAHSTSMILEKAKTAKLPKWLLVAGLIIIVSLISLNVYFIFFI